MLRKLLSQLAGGSGAGERAESAAEPTALRQAARSAIEAFLREPLAHPAVIDYELMARIKAASSAADYMVEHMMSARNLVRRAELLEFALGCCGVDGLVLECGVFRGESLRFLAKRHAGEVHGFDSFEGLPDDWTYSQKQGRFSLGGQAPEFSEPNVRVYPGWFDATLPPFLAAHAGAVRFLHVDCDIYSSTKTALDLLAPRLVRGSIVVFDEYLGYPSWQQHEFRAFQEFVAARELRYRYIGFASSHTSVAVAIE